MGLYVCEKHVDKVEVKMIIGVVGDDKFVELVEVVMQVVKAIAQVNEVIAELVVEVNRVVMEVNRVVLVVVVQ